MQKHRVLWADVAKGIGILAVIIGHLGVPLFNRLVFPWHMPLFFILSGMFMSVKNTPGDFCKNKLRSLLVPFVVTSIALVVAEGFWGMYSQGIGAAALRMSRTAISALCGSGSMLVFGRIRGIGAIWFLEALCIALVTLRFLMSNRYRMWIIATLFLVSWWSAKFVWLPFNIQSGLFAVPFVYYGYLVLKSCDLTNNRSKLLAVLGMFSMTAIFLLNRPVMSMVRNHAMPWDLLVAPLIVHFVVSVSDVISRLHMLCSILSWYGRNSLTILCCHLFELNEVPWNLCFAHLGLNVQNGYQRLALLIIAKIVFATIGTFVINKLKAQIKKVRSSTANVCGRIA